MLKGGTAGQQQQDNESGSNFGSFTHAGVKTIYASPKKTTDVRILPAFDMSLGLEDAEFSKSFVSYRDANETPDEETGTEAFTEWFYMVDGYTYMGLGRRQFLSPLTGTMYYPAGHDPIRDAWKYIDKYVDDVLIKQLAHGKTVIDEVSKKEKKLPGYLSKTPRKFALANVVAEGETRGVWENAVMIFSQTTIRDLKTQLSVNTKKSDDVVISEEWPDYYYGDVTDPSKGCIARVAEKEIRNSSGGKTRTSGFYLEQAPEDLENHKLLVRPCSEEELKKRYRIFDTVNVTNLPEKEVQYQIILDYLVEDGVVPLSVLEVACGKYGKINHDLRKKSMPWFEGEPPVEDAGQLVATRTPVKKPVAQNSLQSTAPAVGVLAESKKQAETDDVVNEDVPIEGKDPKTPFKTEAPETKAGAGRFQELQDKLKQNEPLSPSELQELGELARLQV